MWLHNNNAPSTDPRERERDREMKSSGSVLLQILVVNLLVVACVSQSSYDFFYLVQQWPGSYCDSDGGCCYPTTVTGPNFTIHGLWPNYDDGSYPEDCDSGYPFSESQITNLVSSLEVAWPSFECGETDKQFWTHEWDTHGTCSDAILDENQYFSAALKLYDQINLLAILEAAGITPNGNSYTLTSISAAISATTGYTPGLDCNKDDSGKSQLYEIYLCVNYYGTAFIQCPILPTNSCAKSVEFPAY